MKRIIYLLFTISVLFSCVFCVNASCTEDEIKILKEEASNIKVTYKHLGAVQDENGLIYYNRFEVKIKNVSDDFYVLYSSINGDIKLTPSDGMIKDTFINGTYIFNIYSNKCEEKISDIGVFVPKFNIYSLDPLCEGIDGDKFPLCGKYYEYNVSYDDFIVRVNHYRVTYNLSVEDDNLDEEDDINILDIILKYLLQYQIYIVVFLFILLVIIIVLIVIDRRKKKSILQ